MFFLVAIFAVNFSSFLCVILTAINYVLNDSFKNHLAHKNILKYLKILNTYFSYSEIFCSNFVDHGVASTWFVVACWNLHDCSRFQLNYRVSETIMKPNNFFQYSQLKFPLRAKGKRTREIRHEKKDINYL